MISKKKILIFSIFSFISIIVFLLIYKQIVYPTIQPMFSQVGISPFADWSVIVNANICDERGYDVFTANPCDSWGRKHIYGEILLYLPYIKKFPMFYFLYFPIILNLTFLWIAVSNLFTYQNKRNFFLLFFFLINMPILLAIERANIDIIIFIFIFLIAKTKNIFLKYLLIVLSTITKFYPACLAMIFFFEKKFKNTLINLLIIGSITSILFIFQMDNLQKIFGNLQQFSGYGFGVYEFSFIGGAKFINFLTIGIDGKNYSWIKYIILFFLVLLPIIYANFFYSKKIYYHSDIANLFIEDTYENKLYVLSSVLIVFCYFSFSNFIYREIFFIGLIPWILKKEKNLQDNNFLTSYLYILFFKFLLTTPLVYMSKNKIFPSFEPIFIIIKHSVDFYLMSIVTHIFVFSLISFYKKKFKVLTN